MVGAIVGIARGIPSGTPIVDIWAQPIKGIYWAFIWKFVILNRGSKETLAGIWYIDILASVLCRAAHVYRRQCISAEAVSLLSNMAIYPGLVCSTVFRIPVCNLCCTDQGIPGIIRMENSEEGKIEGRSVGTWKTRG
ncbi:MAG: hypothetical protein ACLRZZ_26005 [Enterocloster sp.]